MVTKYVPEKGDIVWLDFDPSRGKEIMKMRPAYVISRRLFNEHVNMAIVAPITSTIRGVNLEVLLPEKLLTQGSILVYQLKTLDFTERNIKFIEKAPKKIVDRVAEIVHVITN